jgi:hypothetical protein
VDRVLDGSEVWRIFNNRGQTMVFLAISVLSLKTPHRLRPGIPERGHNIFFGPNLATAHFRRDLPLREKVQTPLIAETDKYIVIEAE